MKRQFYGSIPRTEEFSSVDAMAQVTTDIIDYVTEKYNIYGYSCEVTVVTVWGNESKVGRFEDVRTMLRYMQESDAVVIVTKDGIGYDEHQAVELALANYFHKDVIWMTI